MKENLSIVTEVGVFGDLDIKDPTVKEIKKKNSNEALSEAELQEIIKESIQNNAKLIK